MDIECLVKPWEEKFFGRCVDQFNIFADDKPYNELYITTRNAFQEYFSHLRLNEYMTAFVESSNVAVINALENVGFHYLVSVVDLEQGFIPDPPVGRHSFNIRPFVDNDLSALENIAFTSFKYSRWHAEHRLPDNVANEMHREWVRNCCKGSEADEVFVYDVLEKPVGFIALKYTNGVAKIVLIATDNDYQGKGIGNSLVDTAVNWAKYKGAYVLKVRTEFPNKAAMKIYLKNNFRMIKDYVYLGRWHDYI